jgi:hypothetical protein
MFTICRTFSLPNNRVMIPSTSTAEAELKVLVQRFGRVQRTYKMREDISIDHQAIPSGKRRDGFFMQTGRSSRNKERKSGLEAWPSLVNNQ